MSEKKANERLSEIEKIKFQGISEDVYPNVKSARPFDSAINHLNNRLNSRGEGSEREELRQAILVLEDWPKWEPLIEAAGKMDKRALCDFIHLYLADLDPNPILEFMETVYMALPDKEE